MTVDGRIQIISHALTLNKLLLTWLSLLLKTNTIAAVCEKGNRKTKHKKNLRNVMLWTYAYNDNVILGFHVDTRIS